MNEITTEAASPASNTGDGERSGNVSLTQAEFNAYINDKWEYYPVTDVQVKISPDGVAGVAVPFYLLHQRLAKLERAESEAGEERPPPGLEGQWRGVKQRIHERQIRESDLQEQHARRADEGPRIAENSDAEDRL